jgi:uncharacterized membrane protein YgdD (TMEM256/DUF423 family)
VIASLSKLFLAIGAIAGGVSVALGAFAAHGLQSRVTPERLATFQTGARYQMYHALALLVVGWLYSVKPCWQASLAGWLFCGGILVFSGSLYLLVLTDTRVLGAITPLGGLCFIAGWGMLAWAALR